MTLPSTSHLLDGQAALVTGAAAGIGESIAITFARHGAKVVLLDRDGDGAARVAAAIAADGGTARAETADVRDPAALAAAVDASIGAFGRIDVLVNNAGAYPRRPFLEMSETEWDDVLAVNLKSVFLCSRLVLPHMVRQGAGAIVNISSVTFFLGMERLAHYVSAKGGIIGLTRVLAREMGRHGIRVNCISPGAIRTESEKQVATVEEANAVIPLQCLKRRIMPDDVANVALFLASGLGGAITGQTLNVDGGWIHY